MSEYTEIARNLPRPSPEQVNDFVEYVAEAHSWYKHLPPTPPGIPFYFFVDPNVGCDLVVEMGKATYFERERRGFHYADLPTTEYRRRFGHLQYSTNVGTSILVPLRSRGVLVVSSTRSPAATSAGIPIRKGFTAWLRSLISSRSARWSAEAEVLAGALKAAEGGQVPAIQSAEKARITVPNEILETGRVELTSIIHPLASTVWVWRWLSSVESIVSTWPPETGGPETVHEIFRLLRDNPDLESHKYTIGPNGNTMFGFDQEIHRLVEPERRRLKRLMEEAIQRVLRLVYD